MKRLLLPFFLVLLSLLATLVFTYSQLIKLLQSGFSYIVTATVTLILSPFLLWLAKRALGYLKEWGSYALDGLIYQITKAIKHKLAASLTLKKYARLQLRGQSQYLYIPSRSGTTVDTDKIYVPLSLSGAHVSKKRILNENSFLEAGSRLRVVGDPGSGKSSFVKRVLRDACRQAIEKPAKARLPVLLELKNLTLPAEGETADGNWLYEFIRKKASECAVYQMAECFDTYGETTGLLTMLDGLDEVATEHYPIVERAINELSTLLSAKGENNVLIVTTRTQFHQQIKERYRDALPVALSVKPFSPSDIFTFLTRWDFEGNKDEEVARLYKDLTDRPSLREMCGNPLVLAMYVAEDQSGSRLAAPESRTEFYSRVVEELVILRRERQIGSARASFKLREQRERILGRLAFDHLLGRSTTLNVLNVDDAIVIIQEIVHCNEDDALKLFRELAKETGLIGEEQVGRTFRFNHLTFCEYFCAYEAVKGRDAGLSELLDRHRQFVQSEQPHLRSRLLEALPFACGLLPRYEKDTGVSAIAKLEDNRLLAKCFLEAKPYEHEAWKIYFEEEQSILEDTPETSWDDEWLDRLYLLFVVAQDAKACALHIGMAEDEFELLPFFERLSHEHGSAIEVIIDALASRDGVAAFRLAEVLGMDFPARMPTTIISAADQAPFLGLIISEAERDVERADLWASLLCEAALASRPVAEEIGNREPYSDWESVERKRSWSGKYFDVSFYTQCLERACRYSGINTQTFPYLSVVKNIRPPGSFYFFFLESASIATTAAITANTLWHFLISSEIESNSPATPPILALISMFFILIFWWMVAMTRLATVEFYRKIIFHKSLFPQNLFSPSFFSFLYALFLGRATSRTLTKMLAFRSVGVGSRKYGTHGGVQK